MREIPASIETEKAYLGAIIQDPEAKFKAPINPEVFYDSRHQVIYSAMKAIERPDLTSLAAYLEEKNTDIKRSYLVELANSVATSFNIKNHAKILKEKHLRRVVLQGLEIGMQRIYDEELPSVLGDLKHLLIQSSTGNPYETTANPDLIENWYRDYDLPPNFIKTGIWTIDNAIGGITPSDFALIMADTNVGKTTLLLNMAIQMAKMKKKVLFFSLEMTANQLNDKFVSIYGNVNAMEVKNRTLAKTDLRGTVERFKSLPITVVHRGSITSQDVISEAYNRKLSGEVDIVMVDYVQRLADKSKESETIKMKTIAQNLKNFALTNEIPVLTPAQVDKASSQGGKIKVENVAWAKALADEADLALYLYEKEEKIGKGMLQTNFQIARELRCRVVKSRHSEKGQDFKIDFDRTNLRMEDVLSELQDKISF